MVAIPNVSFSNIRVVIVVFVVVVAADATVVVVVVVLYDQRLPFQMFPFPIHASRRAALSTLHFTQPSELKKLSESRTS